MATRSEARHAPIEGILPNGVVYYVDTAPVGQPVDLISEVRLGIPDDFIETGGQR